MILIDQIPFNDVPKYLSMADLVILPQRRIVQAMGQIPAKIFDAMAMAKPIIATDVSDLRRILDGCGIIIEPEDIDSLACKIDWVFSNPTDASALGSQGA